MAVADAMSNMAQVAKISEAERKRREAEQTERWARSTRETALEMALKMCPPDMVRSADTLLSDAEKLTAFMLSGKTPAKAVKAPQKAKTAKAK